jgi:D-alanyl-D-alanine carboxypeptidase/D-alanyl-D-alanine-endopeptidase (penicillin-binding protein 4)
LFWGLLIALGLSFSIEPPEASSQQTAEPSPLVARLEPLVSETRRALAGVKVGVHVATSDGTVLFASGDTVGLNTASNTKIVTAAAALARLGPAFQFTTSVWVEGLSSDGTAARMLYLKGGADPLLGLEDVRRLARKVRVAGITKIGRVVVDDSYFDDDELPPHYDEQPDETASFRAAVSAAGLAFAGYTVHVVARHRGSGPATLTVVPETDYLRLVEGSVTTVRRGRNRVRHEHRTRGRRLEIRVSGQIRAGSSYRLRKRIPDPSALAGSYLRTALIDAGVAVGSRAIREGEVSPKAELIATQHSATLGVLLRGLGKYSNNYMAEVLLKTLGAEASDSGAPGTWAKGLEVVDRFLVDDVGLEKGSFAYGNGSGLFESNRFTARQIAKVLAFAASDFRTGPELIGSLATVGVDGTLRNRLDESVAAGRIRAKTGTLAAVSALSGFAGLDPREPLIFSILMNEIPGGELVEARRLQDRMAEELIHHLLEQATTAAAP